MARKKTAAHEAESTHPEEVEFLAEHSDDSQPPGDYLETAEVQRSANAPVQAADPRPWITVNLSDHSGGPAVHLLRSIKFKQLQIRFDNGHPEEPYQAMLKSAGWRDRTEAEGVWTKQIDPNARWQSVAQMEQEFKAIANAIREDKGLGPVLESLAVR